jgi:hypothetical protein
LKSEIQFRKLQKCDAFRKDTSAAERNWTGQVKIRGKVESRFAYLYKVSYIYASAVLYRGRAFDLPLSGIEAREASGGSNDEA